jgi:hypothetical protein
MAVGDVMRDERDVGHDARAWPVEVNTTAF